MNRFIIFFFFPSRDFSKLRAFIWATGIPS
jgi:hypothetical protein